MSVLHLTDRCAITVTGQDAGPFLQGIVTTDLESLADDEVRSCALLTPQGKILFDFLLSGRGGDGFLIDVDRSAAADLVKRLTLYKLRAKAEIAELENISVFALWDEPVMTGRRDTRFADADVRRLYAAAAPAGVMSTSEDYDRLRVANGVGESGRDFVLSDVFPHDVLMDLNGGVSFRKGCFVGQEVVSRMHHRKSARRRLVTVEGAAPLPASGSDIQAGDRSIGRLGTVAGAQGLALVRVDRVADALAAGHKIMAEGVEVTPRFAPWTGLSFDQFATADAD